MFDAVKGFKPLSDSQLPPHQGILEFQENPGFQLPYRQGSSRTESKQISEELQAVQCKVLVTPVTSMIYYLLYYSFHNTCKINKTSEFSNSY